MLIKYWQYSLCCAIYPCSFIFYLLGFISLSIIPSPPMWQMVKFCSSFMAEWCSVACIIYSLFILLMGNLGCFHILAIVSNATVNIGVHVTFQISLFASFGYLLPLILPKVG